MPKGSTSIAKINYSGAIALFIKCLFHLLLCPQKGQYEPIAWGVFDSYREHTMDLHRLGDAVEAVNY